MRDCERLGETAREREREHDILVMIRLLVIVVRVSYLTFVILVAQEIEGEGGARPKRKLRLWPLTVRLTDWPRHRLSSFSLAIVHDDGELFCEI